ncbi:MAG: transposase [Ardenticatenaceae bacterium]|nr:transposase [Ardenticatenaceae bacterium]
MGILPEFTGALVHDNWATYFKYQLLLHALCNAHHLRELTAVVENDQQQWAALMIACLLAAKQLVAEAIRQVKPNCQSSNCNESTRCMTPLLPSV